MRRAVDENEREREAPVHHPERDSLHGQPGEARADERAEEEKDRCGEQERKRQDLREAD